MSFSGIVNAESAVSYAFSYSPTYTYEQYDSTYHVATSEYGEQILEEHFYVPLRVKSNISIYAPPVIYIMNVINVVLRK